MLGKDAGSLDRLCAFWHDFLGDIISLIVMEKLLGTILKVYAAKRLEESCDIGTGISGWRKWMVPWYALRCYDELLIMKGQFMSCVDFRQS